MAGGGLWFFAVCRECDGLATLLRSIGKRQVPCCRAISPRRRSSAGGYHIIDTLNSYANVSRGCRPNLLQFNDDAIEDVDAEIAWNYEMGFKGETAAGLFTCDLAAFDYDYSNFQAQVENPNAPPFHITADGGNARAVGFEAAPMHRFADPLGGFINDRWVDAGFNALNDDGNPQSLARNRNRFRLTPEHTLALGLEWPMPLGNGSMVYLRPNNWRSQVFFNDDNRPGIEAGQLRPAQPRCRPAPGE